ncbi:tyrosine-type recombinase/integrase [Rhizobium sp. BK379]|uniref:tyrosine-type recombinase/integrase n=1 Tax=Rhizobium sp. BK379 TaxID=2587059 RepID=UPI0016117626|nr:tyrosine-type recombinase/integrase [Rhizobium sp. BK379]MBB3444232.1 integrase [Rhizobium sp. BK379]
MTVLLKGLTKVRKTLADGKTLYYCYPWRGKGAPLLKHEDGSPIQPDDAALSAAYITAREARRNPVPTTLAGLVTAFRASSDFKSKSASTQREYDRYLDDVRAKFGVLTIRHLEAKATRGKFKAWRDLYAEHPRTADYAWTTLARLLSFGKDRGLLSTNIAERGGKLYRADRREKIWTEADVAKFVAVASPALRLAITLALATGQRKGDLLAAKWSAYDGEVIRFRQSKTGAKLVIPLTTALRTALKAAPRAADTILVNSRGDAWTSAGFSTSWRKACTEARIEGLTFHDLRGTTVTRLAIAGCTAAEIGAITGHSMRDVAEILDAHYLGGKEELARRAIEKLEAANDPTNCDQTKSQDTRLFTDSATP